MSNFNNHHKIPLVIANHGFQFLEQCGFGINDDGNLIELPTTLNGIGGTNSPIVADDFINYTPLRSPARMHS